MLTRENGAKNNKTRFFYVFVYSDETWVFDQSERVQGPIYIVITNAPFSLFALLHLS